jgi:TP901 family phage tail tape measure protein
MADTIVLRTELRDGANVLAQLTQIDAKAKSLGAKPVTIEIKVTGAAGIEKLTRQQLALALAQERRRIAETNLAIAQERTKQTANQVAAANTRLQQETQRTTTEQERQKTAAANLALQQERTKTATEQHANAEANLQRQLNGTSQAASSLGASLVKSLANRALTAALQAMRQSLREALSTMKEVDSELTTIQKVTGASDSYIAGLNDRAYETASKYGVKANEFLQSVAEFSRAGYGELAEGLAEVATKTQLVGDINSETANKMLIAMDAAYKLGGSVEALSLIVDQANEIDNNYATSIEKLASGMPIVASVAAQAHITQEQLLAALGTITAKTQVSGSEAARAFRAIVLNIMGDTTTEVEEGVTVTKEEIQSLSDVLEVYASDVVEAARATGELVNPMEAIAALSKAMKEGALTEQQLMEMLSGLGGKLRTNSLVALVEGFDTYKKMLGSLGDAAGSADNEVGTMLTSWQSKANILKNTWTDLVQTVAGSDKFKAFLDDVNSALSTLVELFSGDETTSEDFRSAWQEAANERDALIAKGEKLTDQEELRLNYLREQTKELARQALYAEREEIRTRLEDQRATPDYVWMSAGADATNKNTLLNQLGALNSDYYQTGAKTLSQYRDGLKALSEQYQGYATVLEEAQDAGLKLNQADERALWAWEQLQSAISTLNHLTGESTEETETSTDTASDNADAVDKQAEAYESLSDRVKDAASAIDSFKKAAASDQDDGFQDMADAYAKTMEEIANGRISSNTAQAGYGLFLSDKEREALENDPQKMAAYIQGLEGLKAMLSGGGEDAGAGFAQWLYNAADAEGKLRDENGKLLASFEKTDSGLSFTVESLQDLADYTGVSEDVILSWAEAMGVYGSEIYNAGDQALKLAEDVGALTKAADGTQNVDLDKFRKGLSEAGKSQEEIEGLVSTLQSIDGITFEATESALDEVSESVDSLPEDVNIKLMADAVPALGAIQEVESTLSGLTGKNWTVRIGANIAGFNIGHKASGGKSSGGGLTLVNEQGPEIIQEGSTARIAGGGEPTVTMLAPGAMVYTAPQTRRMLHGQRPDGLFRAAARGYYDPTGELGNPDKGKFYVPGLSGNAGGNGGGGGGSGGGGNSEYWKELQEAMDKKFDEAEKARKAELADLDAQLEALKKARDTEEDRLELEEKILAVTEAQAKLANAQAERNVRMYNAATGQWEWIADQKAVQSAKDQLKKAQDALDKYRKDQEYDAAVAAIKAQQDAVNARYDELENKWKEILESVEEPLREIADILADVARSGTDRQKGETANVKSLAELIANFIATNPSGWKLPGYDSGGVLRGMGGVKATSEDEIVLGPALSAKILTPTPNAQFDAFARALGAVYGMPNAGIPTAPTNSYGASTDSHDTVYSFPGGINLTEQQANTTTLGELARQLRILNLT